MGTCYLRGSTPSVEIERVLEDDEAAIANRLERDNVAAIEPTFDAGALLTTGKVHFRPGARAEA